MKSSPHSLKPENAHTKHRKPSTVKKFNESDLKRKDQSMEGSKKISKKDYCSVKGKYDPKLTGVLTKKRVRR